VSGPAAIHPAAARGFDDQAGAYDRGRPDYPADAVAYLVDALQIGPGATVVEIAAGTGKLTRALAPTGAELIAVEPVQGMRQVLCRNMPHVDVVDGTAESTSLPRARADVVVVAQAFHWFDGPRALAECARILRPGGRLGLVFNVRDENDQVHAELERVWEPHRGLTPTHRGGAWQAAFDRQDRFSPPVHRAFRHEQRLNADRLVDRVVSVSFIATLPGPDRARVEDRVRALVGDAAEVGLPYRTDVYRTQLR
jgi:SAM-dependent methyltransferase